ncbi:hypothetical protein ACJIZ3_020816 [Penstemon smallii]|uniref:Uncharacterized protein n=1 Tax=Penstemon smallii TaxID=265156 RepID=A0ABD3SJW3_9LAMI
MKRDHKISPNPISLALFRSPSSSNLSLPVFLLLPRLEDRNPVTLKASENEQMPGTPEESLGRWLCSERRRLSKATNQHSEGCDSNVGTELLDIILTKVPSSPPFFTGSPPNRASNPVIQDEQFSNDHGSPLSSSSIHKTGGSVRVNCRPNLAPVRIEGFNCRGNGNSSISAMA